jgi:pimeloyl-ACP methyl ester carboxylesterase
VEAYLRGAVSNSELPMTARDYEVRLSDGRMIQVSEFGDLHGKPVFVLHGQPGSRLQFSAHIDNARKRGIRLIGHNRAGYGGSTRKPGRAVVDAAHDVRAVADEMGIDRFAVWGISAGGAPALSCAATLEGRAVAVASLAAVAPYPAEGIDWFAGMGAYNVADFKLMMSDQKAWEAKAVREAAEIEHGTVQQLIEMLSTLLSDADRAALTPEFAEYLLAQEKEAFNHGIGGSVDDCLSQVKPWGFDLGSIRVPLQYWHGQQDMFCPYSHGQWIAARLPSHCDLHLTREDGHLTLYANRIPQVHEWLVSHF